MLGDILSLRSRAVPPANQTAGDGLILPAAHEQAKFKVFLVKFIAGVVDLGRGDDLGAGKLKYLADIRLIGAVAARQALQVHHQHPGVQPCVDLLQQLLNLRPCGNGFAGDDLIIGFGHAVPALSCQTVQNGLVPLERFFHTHFSIIPVETGFSEILCVLLHARPPRFRAARQATAPQRSASGRRRSRFCSAWAARPPARFRNTRHECARERAHPPFGTQSYLLHPHSSLQG